MADDLRWHRSGRGGGRDRAAVISDGIGGLARWGLRIGLIAVGAVVVGWVLGAMWSIILPMVFALLLTTVLYPPARWLIRHRWPPALAASLVVVGAFVLIGGIFAALAPSIAGQADQIVSGVTAGLTQIQGWLAGPPFNLGSGEIGDALDQVVAQLRSSASTIAGGVLSGVGAFASGLLNVVLAIVLAFFFIKDGDRFMPWLVRHTGNRAGRHVRELLATSWRTLAGFFRVQALVSLIDAVLIGLGLVILGVPLALPLIVLTFVGGFIPVIGALVAGAFAVLVALVTKGLTTAIIVLAIIIVVQQLEGNVLQPMLQSRSLGLHGAVVILAVTAGGALAGIAGAFLAVPTVAVGAGILTYLAKEVDRRADPESDRPVYPPEDGPAGPAEASAAGAGETVHDGGADGSGDETVRTPGAGAAPARWPVIGNLAPALRRAFRRGTG